MATYRAICIPEIGQLKEKNLGLYQIAQGDFLSIPTGETRKIKA
jgi:hypothetical protein